MRKTSTPTLKQLVLSALFATTAVSISHASTIAESYEQRSVIDFENLAIGAAPTTGTEDWTAWTLGTDTRGAAPNAPTYNTSGVALAAPGSTKLVTTSSAQTNPLTQSDEIIYFSAWVYRTDSTLSGARITIRDVNTGGSADPKLGGFGIIDSSSRAFAFYNGTDNSWIQSDLKADNNSWYEMALVIHMDDTDISKSLGSLYVRNVTSGQSDFTLVTFDSGATTAFEMSWFTNEFNARDSYAYWRIDNFRSAATGTATQIDNLAVGVIKPIPEPGVALLGVGGLLMIPFFKNRSGRKL